VKPRGAIRQEDAERIATRTRELLATVQERLLPTLLSLSRRCGGAWGPTEQAEYEAALDRLLRECRAELEADLFAAAIPDPEAPFDS